MIKRPDDIPNYLDLVANLEEFGLSKYESMAYITLVSKGTLGASEIAYYSNLPRTKIYTTLKKLERKKLSTISSQKPMIATATPPDEAFGELITMQQGRLASMHNILNSLKKLRDEEKKPYEEKKYLVLEPNAVVQKIEELISSTKSNIDFILDSWGQNVVFQSNASLSEAVKRGVKINILLGIQSFANDNDVTFPTGVEVRSDNVSGNIIIFDFKRIIFIDSTNGKASLILTPDAFGNSYIKLFDEKWKKALRINPSVLGNRIPKEAIILTKLVEDDLTQILLDLSIKQDSNYSSLIGEIEKFSSDIKCQSIDDMIRIVDSALKISYSGYLNYEAQNNMLKLHFDSKEKSIVPWVLIITAYIKKFGNDSKIIHDHGEKNTNSIYIKLLNPNVIHVN
ncbi:MAG: helix-turn-helix domain-containing protein [Nitrososphaeraceae archaeon]|nr:helix-turn-helix domain-containing protein [Nitrososphaeraceae archaeon]MDW0182490.1 helix-turn-helix domain-containing protein [Nitrososphaeraceae archaeon]MDW0231508.1 helix-turn-helix domain-containing protein [Nitrososphaeraceae archaeon]MDW0251107.1 helix-turn-helix domain-containing protein [Nitrososphaeraceae archaeon]MDW0283871.1 helix-turn-helix domain-containing protein [Nitrososphaeraceae archaeon]